MDKRLQEIAGALADYATGRFDRTLSVSPQLDELDAISNGINILGQELKAVTISRNYFNGIFHAVSDMVFILDARGMILDANLQATQQLAFYSRDMPGIKIHTLVREIAGGFNSILKQLKTNDSWHIAEAILLTRLGTPLQVRMQASWFKDEQRKQRIVITASDISYQLETENLILRAVIDTQEKERQRLSQDLHDSLTQQLSGIKLFISSSARMVRSRQIKENLSKSNQALDDMITDMRNICFSLMPKTLEAFGLVKAVREYCDHFLMRSQAKFIIEEKNRLPALSNELKIDLYRIIQEFINNALKHGHAAIIRISLACSRNVLKLGLLDNGVGFDSAKPVKGMGLHNVRSRVKSHKGRLDIKSSYGKGTCFNIVITLNGDHENTKAQ